MNEKIIKTLLPIFCGLVVLSSGCSTIEKGRISKLSFFERKTDVIPGLDPPHQRKKLIREKGTKGATASEAEKEILVAQLVYEYQTSPDPNMRREAVDALAKIPHPQRDRYLQEILQDDNPFVRLSALEALGKESKQGKMYSGSQSDLTTILIDRMKADPDKDVRLAAVRILGDTFAKDKSGDSHSSVVLELGNLLEDKVPAIRYEAMQSLQKVTKQDYGNDINRWAEYMRYARGEVPNLPAERTLAEKMPRVALPMFK